MNKRFLFLLIAVAVISSCNSTPKTSNTTETATEVTEQTVKTENTVSQLLMTASDNVDKEVLIEGKVKHVCSHSGKRCFITDEAGNSIKVEATGELKGFNKEVMGMTIKVKGILKEQKITKEEIDKMSADEKADSESGHCESESDNILKMREWMKANGKDYYSFYYVDGTEYDIVK